jgi:hypothetical protein
MPIDKDGSKKIVRTIFYPEEYVSPSDTKFEKSHFFGISAIVFMSPLQKNYLLSLLIQ